MKLPRQLHLQLCLQFELGTSIWLLLWGSTAKRNPGSASGLVLEKKFKFWFESGSVFTNQNLNQ